MKLCYSHSWNRFYYCLCSIDDCGKHFSFVVYNNPHVSQVCILLGLDLFILGFLLPYLYFLLLLGLGLLDQLVGLELALAIRYLLLIFGQQINLILLTFISCFLKYWHFFVPVAVALDVKKVEVLAGKLAVTFAERLVEILTEVIKFVTYLLNFPD